MTRPHASNATIISFEPAHAAAAAALVAERVRVLRETVGDLPDAWTDVPTLARLISELVLRGTGVAAVAGRRLVGFQAATLIDGHGGRWSYTPDFGHAATGAGAGRVVEAMYARLADAWAREACLEHVVTALAGDDESMATLVRLGFGQTVIDLVRDLSPVQDLRRVPGMAVRRAGSADAAAVVELETGLRRHLAAPPIFLRMGTARPPELHRRILADPAQATFLAEVGGRAIATLRIGPSATDVATIVRDPGTASITAAFTVVDRRGDGVRRTCSTRRSAGHERRATSGSPWTTSPPTARRTGSGGGTSRRWPCRSPAGCRPGRRRRALGAVSGPAALLSSQAMEIMGVTIRTIVEDNVAIRCDGCREVIPGTPWRVNLLDIVAPEVAVGWTEAAPINPGPHQFHSDPACVRRWMAEKGYYLCRRGGVREIMRPVALPIEPPAWGLCDGIHRDDHEFVPA